MRTAVLAAALLLAVTQSRAGVITISEVLYDAAGPDDGKTFVELFGPPGLDLTGYFLEGVNGAGGGVTHRLDLAGLTVPGDGFLLLADEASGGGSSVPGADLLFPDLDFQNGPDSIRLLAGSVVVDAIGYGSFTPGLTFAGEGDPAPDAAAGSSLARLYADLDTDVNRDDFEVRLDPTPGTGPIWGPVSPVPEPGTWMLLGAGLAAVVVTRRSSTRRRRRSRGRGASRG